MQIAFIVVLLLAVAVLTFLYIGESRDCKAAEESVEFLRQEVVAYKAAAHIEKLDKAPKMAAKKRSKA